MKTIQYILLSLCFLSTSISAKQLEIRLEPNSLLVRNDTLFFRYCITSQSDTPFVVYNARYSDFLFEDSDAYYLKHTIPGLGYRIYDKNNRIKKEYAVRTTPFIPAGGEMPAPSYFELMTDKYIILSPKTKTSIFCFIELWHHIHLKKGKNKLQLRFFSNNYYKQIFRKEQQSNPKLKGCVLYYGFLNSNICDFYY